ncbi:phosphoenolpyruvate synthase [Patescibacteria group bacterium]|nr:phosphoenolpyruvate synthase [Patescibacteria group bacterium]
MTEEKGVNRERPDLIKWFSELNKNSGNVAGGKGANLGEIYNIKIPVPPGFAITAQAYDYFIEKSRIKEKIKELLEKINYEDTDQLNNVTKEIRSLIENSPLPKEMEEEILEAYEILGTEDAELKNQPAYEMISKGPSIKEESFVAVRSSATMEDLAEASFAGQQETFLNVRGGKELLSKVKRCFSSLFTPRATYYRNQKGFKHEEASLSVIVQKMVDSDRSGVIFSKDPTLKRDDIIIEAVFGLGEGIVSGQITPDTYIVLKEEEVLKIKNKEIGTKKIAFTRDSSGKEEIVELKEEKSKQQALTDYEIKILAEIALKLEEHYQKPQDIEFAIEGGKIFIVQTRPITTIEKRMEVGLEKEIEGEVILKGLAASPGIASGNVRIIGEMEDLKKIIEGDILVTKMTNPDMVVTMKKCSAIVTDEGGLTAHASIVSREMGIPAIVGTEKATSILQDGEIITVNGFDGKIYRGKVSENVQKEIKPVTVTTRTKLKVLVDLPSFAERASKTNLKGVGLARLEGIIAESGKHPQYFLEKNDIGGYEGIIFNGLNEIAKYFEEIWVRTSDIRSDEFRELEGSPKEVEANPMLGMHGIRYSLKYPEILKAELNAMKRISDQGKKIGILAPQIISVEEVKKLKELVNQVGFNNAKIGIMIETPASVQIIKELCEEGVDFISFGTNDLTQYTLAVDRGNEEVQEIYNEMHPAILNQIEYVIKLCKEKGIETSVCGQAGSKKEMVKFLFDKGIDSLSLNADVASEIGEYVSELEKSTPQPQSPEEELEKSQEVVENRELTELQNPSSQDASQKEPQDTSQEESQNENPDEASGIQNPDQNSENSEENQKEGNQIENQDTKIENENNPNSVDIF